MESNRICSSENSSNENVFCLFPSLSRLLIFFSCSGIGSFHRPFLSLLLSSLVFFTLARFLRAPLPRELALRAILRTFVISRNRGVLVKSSVSILENVKKRWVESRGCGFPPHFHANSVKTPILNPEERTKLPLRFTSTCSDLLLCLSYSISSIVPWQSLAGIIRRIGF